MSVFVRTKAMVAGEERDVLVEVHRLDALSGGEAPCVLLDDFTVWAAPGRGALAPRLDPDDEDELMSVVEIAIEGIVAR